MVKLLSIHEQKGIIKTLLVFCMHVLANITAQAFRSTNHRDLPSSNYELSTMDNAARLKPMSYMNLMPW